MKALLLAAGFGTRLQPLTNYLPKCLMPIKGKCLLEYWLDTLDVNKINEIFINICPQSLGEYIKYFIDDYQKKNNVSVTILNEEKLLGTCGTIIHHIHRFLGDELLVVHADNYIPEGINTFIQKHNALASMDRQCLMSMLTFMTSQPEQCGIIEVDQDMIVQGFYEKSREAHGYKANAAVYLLKPTLLDALVNQTYSDISTELIPKLLGKIYAIDCHGPVIDIGTIENYLMSQFHPDSRLSTLLQRPSGRQEESSNPTRKAIF